MAEEATKLRSVALLPPNDRLVEVTTRAVDQIGERAALDAEQAADALEAEAKIMADKIRRFATAWRESTKLATADISQFMAKATGITETLVGLQDEIIRSTERKQETA